MHDTYDLTQFQFFVIKVCNCQHVYIHYSSVLCNYLLFLCRLINERRTSPGGTIQRKYEKCALIQYRRIKKNSNKFTFAIFPSFPVKRLVIINFYLIKKIHNKATFEVRPNCASYKYILIRTTCSCKSSDVEKFDRVERSACAKV